MGLFNFMFGNDNKQSSSDGLWLKNYRDCIWKPVISFSVGGATKSFEAGMDSCYKMKDMTFCILRGCEDSNKTIAYFCIGIRDDKIDELNILVSRIEDYSSNTIVKDEWTKARESFYEKTTPGVESAVKVIRAQAKFNNYSTMPPYVMVVTHGLNTF